LIITDNVSNRKITDIDQSWQHLTEYNVN